MTTPTPVTGRPAPPPALESLRNNYDCQLQLNRVSARGVVVDYRIVLGPNEGDIERVIAATEDLFGAICSHYINYRWKARLVALCEYERLNNEGEVSGKETYHHASYQSEWCSMWMTEEFYRRHMLKIANRIETFLRNGSSLRLAAFKHIHVAVTLVIT